MRWFASPKVEACEGLLEHYVQNFRFGADRHITPRARQALGNCVARRPGTTVFDPVCGTGRFLVTAHRYRAQRYPRLKLAESEAAPRDREKAARHSKVEAVAADGEVVSRASATSSGMLDGAYQVPSSVWQAGAGGPRG